MAKFIFALEDTADNKVGIRCIGTEKVFDPPGFHGSIGLTASALLSKPHLKYCEGFYGGTNAEKMAAFFVTLFGELAILNSDECDDGQLQSKASELHAEMNKEICAHLFWNK